MTQKLGTYRRLAALSWPRTYLGKFLLTAFVGVHVPLISVLLFMAARALDWGTTLPILLVTLVATLLGTFATLYVQGRLLAPVLNASAALDAYVERREIPTLPTGYEDEAGRLMRNAQACIEHLDRLVTLKNDLLAVVSHDIRNPITSITAASDLIRHAIAQPEALDREELREYTDIIRDAARRQNELMNNVLLLARAESGQVTVTPSPMSPERMLRRTVDGVRLQARAKGIEVVTAVGADDGREVALDVAKAEQVLANLVQNAVKFTPAGGRVEVGARMDDGMVEFWVRDSGIGIRPEDLEHLFQPFSRAHRPGTAAEPGSGLGLWICRTFTELQGGRITVQSAPDEGSCFRMRLPAGDTHSPPVAAAA